jgi:hypothetical protein
VAETPEELIRACEVMVERTKKQEADAGAKITAGTLPPFDEKMIQARRLSAEIDILRTKRDLQKPTKPAAWAPERDLEIRRMLAECRDYAEKAFQAEVRKLENGKSTSFFVMKLAEQLHNAEMDLAETPEQLIETLEKKVDITTKLEADNAAKVKAGTFPPLDEKMAQACRLSAEIDLLRTKRDFPNVK